MNIVVDMNLSPDWVRILSDAGWSVTHWSGVGDGRAADREIMAWARSHNCVVFTHDLDFGAILAATGAKGPSVIQVRTDDVTPQHLSRIVIPILHRFQAHLEQGSLIVVDEHKSRVRILPLAME